MASERDKTTDRTTSVTAGARSEPATASPRAEIDAFIKRARTLAPPVEAGKRGRLIFALDATMSRQPTWDTACRLQGEMFREAASIGGLDVQLVYFRGLNECRASRWVSDGAGLGDLMARISCQGGHTQIGKVLSHTRNESDKRQGAGAGLCWRRDGRGDRRSCGGGRRAWSARHSGLRVSGGP